MKSWKVLLAALALGCGGDSGGYVTGTPNDSGGGPGSGTGSPSASATVNARSSDDGYGSATFSYSPANVTIQRGGTVTWSNASNTLHNVTFSPASGAPANAGNYASASVSRTFNSAGTYNYECTNHPGMGGTVTVQ